jgi:hypothetical protein
MQVLFINNDGGGFADHIDVEPGTTVAQLFAERIAKVLRVPLTDLFDGVA